MKRTLAALAAAVTLLATGAAACNPPSTETTGGEPGTRVQLKVAVWDDRGIETVGEFDYEVTLIGTGEPYVDPVAGPTTAPVEFTDVKTGAKVPSPYTYEGGLAPNADQLFFEEGMTMVTMAVTVTLPPGWLVWCKVYDLYFNDLLDENEYKNETGLPIEGVATCIWTLPQQ